MRHSRILLSRKLMNRLHVLLAISLGQLAKVVAHCCEPHRIRKRAAMMSQRLSEVAPEFPPIVIAHPQLKGDARERGQVSQEGIAPLRFRARLRNSLQALECAIVVFASVVDRAKDRFVAVYEPGGVHSRDEV